MKIFTVCLSWGFGEWYSRFTGNIQGSYDMLLIPTTLTIISFVFYILYLSKLQITPAARM